MRVWAGVVVVVLGMLAVERPAVALCALQEATAPVSPNVPLRGTIFAYVDSYEPQPPEVRWASGSGTWTEHRLSPSTVRIDFSGDSGAVLVVNSKQYRLSARSPIGRAPRIVEMSHRAGVWACSSHDSLGILLDGDAGDVSAVHARWVHAGGARDYWLVPHNQQVELGKVDCGGTTLPPTELAEGGVLELFAVLADGSERRMTVPMIVNRTMFSTGSGRAGFGALHLAMFALLLLAIGLVTVGAPARRVPARPPQ